MNVRDYEIEFLKKVSQIPDDLWETCFRVPGEGRWWYEALEQSNIDDQFTFFYGLIRHLGCPVGIAPAFFMEMPVEQVAPQEFLRLLRLIGKVVPSVLCQRTLFVGSPILDESRVGLVSHVNRRAALLALQIALEAKAGELRASLIIWKDFPESSSADMDWHSHQRRLFRVISLPNTVVELKSPRKEDYFAGMKRSRRQNLKRKLRRSRERVALSLEILQHPDARTLDDIFRLFWQTYEKSPSKFERLNRKFFEVFAEKQAALFIILREKVTGEMVAFRLCFAMGERLVSMFIGLDYSRPKEWMLFSVCGKPRSMSLCRAVLLPLSVVDRLMTSKSRQDISSSDLIIIAATTTFFFIPSMVSSRRGSVGSHWTTTLAGCPRALLRTVCERVP